MTYSQVWWPILGIRALHLPTQVKKTTTKKHLCSLFLTSHCLASFYSEQCLKFCIPSTSCDCLPLYNVSLIVFLNCKSLWIKVPAKWINVNARTQKWTHKHTIIAHPEQWAAINAAAPGEQLGVWCLARGHLVVVLKVERALYIHSPHKQSLPDRDSNSQPFDYESDSLTLPL